MCKKAAMLVAALFASGGIPGAAGAKGVHPESRKTRAVLVRSEHQALAAVRKRNLRGLLAVNRRLDDVVRAGVRRFHESRGRKVDSCDSAALSLSFIVMAAIEKLQDPGSPRFRTALGEGGTYPRHLRACERSLGVKPAGHADLVTAVKALR